MRAHLTGGRLEPPPVNDLESEETELRCCAASISPNLVKQGAERHFHGWRGASETDPLSTQQETLVVLAHIEHFSKSSTAS